MSGILLTGGGVDSTALLVWLRKLKPEERLTALHVDYGQKAVLGEKNSVSYFCKKYEVPVTYATISLELLAKAAILRGEKIGALEAQNCLDGRNVVLMGMAAIYAATLQVGTVYVGFHREPEDGNFPDATEQALSAMQEVIEKAYVWRVRLEAPLQRFSRLEILRVGIAMDAEIADKSFTCYEAGEKECGKCVHCQKKAWMLGRLACAASH